MSLLGQKWEILHPNVNHLFQRIDEYQQTDSLAQLHDPFAFSQMQKAVQRINLAIQQKERIIIFGDYDVDGMTSCAIIFKALTAKKAIVSYRLPHRVNDGYGLSEKFIDEFAEKNIKLIITVDCGIACVNEIAKANDYGIDTIITDHHRIPEQTPQAHAILHPKHCPNYPYKELTGAGVAYKLAQALLGQDHPLLPELIGLACMGTVADLGPLDGENRLIVQKGLSSLTHHASHGINQLKNIAGISPQKPLTTFNIGFQIAPRLNAAGRIGNPYDALSILLSDNPTHLNQKIQILEKLNNHRRLLTENAQKQITERITDNALPSVIIEHSPDWHVGILGLIASKIVQNYHKPAIILQDRGDHLTASARSPHYFNIIKALSTLKEHLITFGGHAQAAGFSIKKEQLPEFTKQFILYTDHQLQGQKLNPTLTIDCPLQIENLTPEFFLSLKHLAPFGVGNREPTFLLQNISPTNIQLIGKQKNHLTLRLNQHKIIAFNLGHLKPQLSKSPRLNLAFQIKENTFNGFTTLDLHALDFQAIDS